MSNSQIKDPWSFKDDAVSDVVKDFKINPTLKTLLVIPTGGGKTSAAMRAVGELARTGFFTNNSKAMWIVHTHALRDQAIKYLENKQDFSKYKFDASLPRVLQVRMIGEARQILSSERAPEFKLLIIDEAHHSAAQSYKDFFKPKVGILGLTATPSRTDDADLDFEKCSYSITLRELIRRGVVLLPDFNNRIDTNIEINAESLSFKTADTELNKFDTNKRNELLAEKIFELQDKLGFKKALVFAGTNKHAEHLWSVLRQKNIANNSPFNHVGYIFGNKNESGIGNKEYLENQRNETKSILVNCRLLNEGYDDPNLDCVIMATPSNSILYYMQCIGRVVRNPSPESRVRPKAYVIEAVDKLPNAAYRIDNRWLFAEISDYLEPEVTDIFCRNELSFRSQLNLKLAEFGLTKDSYRHIPKDILCEDLSVLLFNGAPSQKDSKWKPLFISKSKKMNSENYIDIFNRACESIDKAYDFNNDHLIFEQFGVSRNDEAFKSRSFRVDFWESIRRAYRFSHPLLPNGKKQKVDSIKYITFVKQRKNIFDALIDYLFNIFIHLYV